jgi:hypothetical protein
MVETLPNVTSDTLDVWDEARDAARQFWTRGSEDERLSDDVRAICGINAQLLAGNSHDIALAARVSKERVDGAASLSRRADLVELP